MYILHDIHVFRIFCVIFKFKKVYRSSVWLKIGILQLPNSRRNSGFTTEQFNATKQLRFLAIVKHFFECNSTGGRLLRHSNFRPYKYQATTI